MAMGMGPVLQGMVVVQGMDMDVRYARILIARTSAPPCTRMHAMGRGRCVAAWLWDV